MNYIRILLPLSLMPAILLGDIESPSGATPIGNFAHKRSPNSLFSFGQNIVSKRELVVYLYLSQLKGKNQNNIEISPQVIYGITNDFSALILIPFVAKTKSGTLHGKGIGDITMQFEYAWYSKTRNEFRNQSTIVANFTVPSGRISPDHELEKLPPIGSGAVTFFLGGTACHTSEQWYVFISDGGIITLKGHNGNKVGNSFLYQGGIGHYIGSCWGITAAGLFEIDGVLSQKNRTCTGADENSGGNTILMGPSLFLGGNAWAFQGGIQFPALQKLNGTQNKQQFSTLFSLSCQF